MKTMTKEVKLNYESCSREMVGGTCFREPQFYYHYTFTSNELIPNPETIQAFVEVEVPETIKEFKQHNDMTSRELLDWLNENYE